jgi:hypothetical protein
MNSDGFAFTAVTAAIGKYPLASPLLVFVRRAKPPHLVIKGDTVIELTANESGDPVIGALSADVAVMVPLPAADGVKVTLWAADELENVSDVGENVPDRVLAKVIVSVVADAGVSVIVDGCPTSPVDGPVNVKSMNPANVYGLPPTVRLLADVNVSVTGPGAVGV